MAGNYDYYHINVIAVEILVYSNRRNKNWLQDSQLVKSFISCNIEPLNYTKELRKAYFEGKCVGMTGLFENMKRLAS